MADTRKRELKAWKKKWEPIIRSIEGFPNIKKRNWS